MVDMIGLGILLRWKDKATAEMKKAERVLGSLGDEADETEKKTARLQASFAKLGKVGAGITAFGIGGAAAIYGLARSASTFEDSLRDTMTMTGLTGDAFAGMERQLGGLAISMSTRFAMSGADINKAFYQVLSSGAQAGTKQFTALTDSALKLARVVGMEPAIAVESLSDALHSFEMDVADAERMADVFFKTSMLGATTVPQMTDAMKEAAKVATEMRLPLEDVAAVLTGFASKGVKGARAGTAFRMVMTKLAAPSGEAADALAKLGVAVYDADTKAMRPILDVLGDMKTGLAAVTHEEREAILKAVSGEEVFAKLGALLATDLSILEGWSDELKRGGVVQTAFQQKARTLSFAMAQARESLRNVAITLGQHLMPILTPVGKGIAWIGGKLSAFLKAHPLVAKIAVGFAAVATAVALIAGPIITVVGLVGALGGIPAILGAVTAGFASLGAAAVTLGGLISAAFWPVTLIAAGIAALYLAFKYNFLGIRTIAVAVGKVFKEYLLGAWEGVKAALSPLIATFRETWAVLKEALAPIWDVVSAIGELIGFSVEGSSSMGTFKKVAAALGKVIGFAVVMPIRIAATAVAYLVKGFAWLLKGAVSLGKWLYGKLQPYLGTIGKVLLYLSGPIGIVIANFGRIKAAVGAVIEWVSANWATIKDVILAPVNAIRAGWTTLTEGLTGAFTTVYDTVIGVFGSIKDTIMGAIDWVWKKVTWVISKIPDAFLPESLEKIKYARLAEERGVAMGGQLVVAATAPAVQRATPRPTIPRTMPAMPALALAGAGGGTVDRSVHIHPGAVVIHATRIDERTAMQIDRELAKLIERRLERQ